MAFILWLRFCNVYYPLVLEVVWGLVYGTAHRFKKKTVMIAQVDVFATWVCKFQKLNTLPNPPEKFRKQVIIPFSLCEGWWYIGIKGDGGV